MIDGSFHGTEQNYGLLGINVGDDSIRKLVMSIRFPDDINIKAIGVDDVSSRRGITYFTVIYAVEDHRLLAILDGRDGVELEKWLDNHPEVRLICRDRSSAYARHIDSWAERHGCKVEQVADRFHLIKNYIDHLRNICYDYLPNRIAFSKTTGDLLDTVPNKCPSAVAPKPSEEEMRSMEEYDNSVVTDSDGNPLEIHLTSMSSSSDDNDSHDEKPADTDPNSRKKTKAQAKKEAAQKRREEKYDIACRIRNEFDPSKPKMDQYKALADKFNIKVSAVARYIKDSDEEIEGLKVAKLRETSPRAKEIDNYKYLIFKLLKAGKDIGNVFWFISEKGYSKSPSTLISYILEIYRIAFPSNPLPCSYKYVRLVYPDDIEVFTRSDILKYLVTVNPKTKVNSTLAAHDDAFIAKYPKAKILRDAFKEFHGVIMGNDVSALEKLCKKPCPISELDSFLQHILKEDFEAVSNAIRYTYSSGFVEGNNHRFKLLKRISYGKLKLHTLVQKCLLAFTSTLDDFKLSQVATWIPLRDDPNAVGELFDVVM